MEATEGVEEKAELYSAPDEMVLTIHRGAIFYILSSSRKSSTLSQSCSISL
jgi:hypothetical protein